MVNYFRENSGSCILHKMKLFGLFREACEKTIAVVNPAADKGMNEFF